MASDAELIRDAAEVLDGLEAINPASRQIVLGIAWAESRYGMTPDWRMPDGTPSHNWGAVVGSGTNGSVIHGDKDKDGKPVSVHFAAFHTAEEGAEHYLDIIGKPNVVAPAALGDAWSVADAMFSNHYYTGTHGSREDRVLAEALLIDGAARRVASALGEKPQTFVRVGGGGAPSTPATTTASLSSVFVAFIIILALSKFRR